MDECEQNRAVAVNARSRGYWILAIGIAAVTCYLWPAWLWIGGLPLVAFGLYFLYTCDVLVAGFYGLTFLRGAWIAGAWMLGRGIYEIHYAYSSELEWFARTIVS